MCVMSDESRELQWLRRLRDLSIDRSAEQGARIDELLRQVRSDFEH